MTRFLFAAGAFALITAAVVTAQNQSTPQPVPAQPPAAAGQPGVKTGGQAGGAGQFGQPARPLATRLTQAEEEVELLEAQRDTRKAHVRAAEVAVEIARVI